MTFIHISDGKNHAISQFVTIRNKSFEVILYSTISNKVKDFNKNFHRLKSENKIVNKEVSNLFEYIDEVNLRLSKRYYM